MAQKAAAVTAVKPIASFTYAGETFETIRRPSAFLVAELAATDGGDASALGVIVDFFKSTLSVEDYQRFRRLALVDDSGAEDGFKTLATILQDVTEQSLQRPTVSSES